MKKLYFLLIAVCFSNIMQSQIINIPDPVFKNYLLTQPCAAFDEPYELMFCNQYIDTNGDGEIQLSEAQSVGALYINNSNITSVQGIEYFIYLYRLGIFYVQIPTLDLSAMDTPYLEVIGPSISSLILPTTPLEGLYVSNTSIESLKLPTLHDGYSAGCTISDNPLLQSIDAKNGTGESYDGDGGNIVVTLENNPSLQSICVDDISFPEWIEYQSESEYWQAVVNNPNVMITTYCDFQPGGNYNTITGNIAFDCSGINLPIPNVPFTITQAVQNGVSYGDLTGDFIGYASSGTVTIAPELNTNYFLVSPSNFTYDFAATGETVNTDFCVSPKGAYPDLEISLVPLTPAVPGFSPTYKLILKNVGTEPASGAMTMSFDDNVAYFIYSVPAISSQLGNLLTWNYSNLMPFESLSTLIYMQLNSPSDNPPLNGGDILTFNAVVTNVGDETPVNNSFTLNQTLVNSLDPNDKTCLEGNVVAPEMVGQYVSYVIRFENTGTANAQNIVVKDMIDTTKFDVSSLIPISGSHPFETRISAGNKVEFIFENINLPFDDINNDGYVAFKIKTKPTLVLGDTFSNSASIYFDYNFPVVTNTATTTIQQLQVSDFDFSTYFTLYPNPVANVLNVKSSDEADITSVSIFNDLGQIVLTAVDFSEASAIDVSQLKTGTYFIRVFSSKGSAISQFIKK